MRTFTETIDRGMRIWNNSLPGRVLDRYVSRRGPLLASGLAYGLLFAFFALIWTIFSLSGIILSGNMRLRHLVVDATGNFLPGLSEDFLTPEVLDNISHTLTWTGLVTVVIFWWTTTGWLDSLRKAVRTMFDIQDEGADLIRVKLGDTLSVILSSLLLILTTVTGAISGGLVRSILKLLKLSTKSFAGSLILDLAGFGSSLVLNYLLFLFLFRVVSHIRISRYTLTGSAFGTVAMSTMQLLATKLLTGASRNPLLAPFAAIIGVLIWFNLISQVIIVCSAFIGESEKGQQDQLTKP